LRFNNKPRLFAGRAGLKMVMKQDIYTDIISEDCTDNQEEKSKRRITYWINVPQAGVAHYGYVDLIDYNDGIILSHIYYFYQNPEDNERVKYITKNGSKYVWINYKYLIDANPLLPIRHKSAISKRIKKLRELGLIITQQTPENTLYVKPTQLLTDIFNYRVESENKRVAYSDPVSPGTTGCYSQEQQGVIPRENSTISNKISNINNITPYNPPKGDDIPYKEIISYLNEKAGTSYRHDTKNTQRFIRARWKEDYQLPDFKLAIDNCCVKWLPDLKMRDFLRPQTIFSSKFESYLNMQGVNASGSPVEIRDYTYVKELEAEGNVEGRDFIYKPFQ